jgi:hypothetical protein
MRRLSRARGSGARSPGAQRNAARLAQSRPCDSDRPIRATTREASSRSVATAARVTNVARSAPGSLAATALLAVACSRLGLGGQGGMGPPAPVADLAAERSASSAVIVGERAALARVRIDSAISVRRRQPSAGARRMPARGRVPRREEDRANDRRGAGIVSSLSRGPSLLPRVRQRGGPRLQARCARLHPSVSAADAFAEPAIKLVVRRS